jgi:hypothetical protein
MQIPGYEGAFRVTVPPFVWEYEVEIPAKDSAEKARLLGGV